MLDENAFIQGSSLLKDAKQSCEPFGGVRVLIVGDFAQLPTVHETKPHPKLLFELTIWKQCKFDIVYLGNPRRCEDLDSVRLLHTCCCAFVACLLHISPICCFSSK